MVSRYVESVGLPSATDTLNMRIQLEFRDYDYARYYNIDGRHYPSVTTVLSAGKSNGWLEAWRSAVGKEEADRVSRQATVHGTAVHAACEAYLKGEEPKMAPLTKIVFDRARPVLDRIEGIVCQEAVVYSHRWRYAGRMDCFGRFDHRLGVIDFKTSKNVKRREDVDGYFVQAAMYACALEHMGWSEPIETLNILVFNESNEPSVFVEELTDSHRQAALDAARTYWNKQMEKVQ